jgi:cyclopropane fatty-acyl-phospholipid synthase-like methyltransferase
VFSSYALHHLTSEEKLGFFQGIRNLLSDHGTFVLIDLTRHNHENRSQFVMNYVAGIRQGWAALNPQEFQLVSEHVEQNDQPETAMEYQRMALEAGLIPIGEGQEHTWHKVQFFGFSKTC